MCSKIKPTLNYVMVKFIPEFKNKLKTLLKILNADFLYTVNINFILTGF